MSGNEILSVNQVLTDRTRLAIVTSLARENKPVAFSQLLDCLNLTRGNLSAHTRKLEEAGLIQIDKRFLDRKPVTSYTCTEKGRTEIKHYLEVIESLLLSAMQEPAEQEGECK